MIPLPDSETWPGTGEILCAYGEPFRLSTGDLSLLGFVAACSSDLGWGDRTGLRARVDCDVRWVDAEDSVDSEELGSRFEDDSVDTNSGSASLGTTDLSAVACFDAKAFALGGDRAGEFDLWRICAFRACSTESFAARLVVVEVVRLLISVDVLLFPVPKSFESLLGSIFEDPAVLVSLSLDELA
jgi:hypothetical protein